MIFFSILVLCTICEPSRLTLQGTVDDVFTDEIDSQTSYLSLKTPSIRYYCSIPTEILQTIGVETLIDADVRVSGSDRPQGAGQRRHMDRLLAVSSASDIQILKRSQTDPFTAPPLSDLKDEKADAIARSGRRSVEGYVKAVWGRNSLFVTTASGSTYQIYLQDGTRQRPKRGDFIRTVGLPETDLFHINLTRAFWKPASPTFPPPKESPIVVVDANVFSVKAEGNPDFRADYTGKTLKLRGIVRDIPPDTTTAPPGSIYLACGDYELAFTAATGQRPFDGLTPGCTVEITCIGVLRTGVWTYTDPTPRIKGYYFVVCDASDVVILSKPSWWTPTRLLTLVLILSSLLVTIIIWNRILQHVINRKSRQLLKEQVGQIRATLRVDERTRLAVELHDALSQNLSGVACQIAATKGTLPESADETARYLETAERMLLSCRTELRRCLWDLRGDALENTNFTEAVRKTLAPVAIGAETIVRFNVPRSRLSDTTAHAVLCIIRELAANAIRHGEARTVRIAGEFHDGTLSFSVRDDGRGFDPERCEGPAEGHFGLEGIRERIKHLGGTFTITSETGKGTRAEVTLTAIQPKDGKPEA